MSESNDAPVKVVDRRWWARDEATAADEAAVRKPTYVEDLQQQLADTTAQLQGVLTEHRRAQQEFEEIRVRMRRDVVRDVERGRRTMLAELLDVLDNLDRAIVSAHERTASPSSDPDSQLLRGVVLVRDEFLAKLGRFGVTRFDSLGQPFDAATHEAVSTATVVDTLEDGKVIAVLKEGYAIGNELLRAASVVVGRHGAIRQ